MLVKRLSDAVQRGKNLGNAVWVGGKVVWAGVRKYQLTCDSGEMHAIRCTVAGKLRGEYKGKRWVRVGSQACAHEI